MATIRTRQRGEPACTETLKASLVVAKCAMSFDMLGVVAHGLAVFLQPLPSLLSGFRAVWPLGWAERGIWALIRGHRFGLW